jgi:hypothetical protein
MAGRTDAGEPGPDDQYIDVFGGHRVQGKGGRPDGQAGAGEDDLFSKLLPRTTNLTRPTSCAVEQPSNTLPDTTIGDPVNPPAHPTCGKPSISTLSPSVEVDRTTPPARRLGHKEGIGRVRKSISLMAVTGMLAV